MLLLGHMGVTLGAAVLADNVLSKDYYPPGQKTRQIKSSPLSKLDLRFVLVGSLLPDIIDKPVGTIFFRDTFSNGRIFSHTLLFLIITALAGLVVHHYYRKLWPLALAFGTFTHLIFDYMWLEHKTLLWPLYGFAFDKEDLTNLVQHLFDGLLNNPSVYVPEIVGATILGWLFLSLLLRKKIHAFVRTGRTR